MNRYRKVTMYIKIGEIVTKSKAYDSHQTLCFTESSVIPNRLLFIY